MPHDVAVLDASRSFIDLRLIRETDEGCEECENSMSVKSNGL